MVTDGLCVCQHNFTWGVFAPNCALKNAGYAIVTRGILLQEIHQFIKSSYLTLNNTAKSVLGRHSRSLEMAPSDRLHTSSYQSSIVSFSKQSEVLVQTPNFSYTLPFDLHDHLEPLETFPKIFTQTDEVPELLQTIQKCCRKVLQPSEQGATTLQTRKSAAQNSEDN